MIRSFVKLQAIAPGFDSEQSAAGADGLEARVATRNQARGGLWRRDVCHTRGSVLSGRPTRCRHRWRPVGRVDRQLPPVRTRGRVHHDRGRVATYYRRTRHNRRGSAFFSGDGRTAHSRTILHTRRRAGQDSSVLQRSERRAPHACTHRGGGSGDRQSDVRAPGSSPATIQSAGSSTSGSSRGSITGTRSSASLAICIGKDSTGSQLLNGTVN